MAEELNNLEKESEILPTYAARVARLLYLRQTCSEKSLVFQTELLLVKSAEPKLKSWLIKLHGSLGLRQLRASIEAELKSLIKEKLKNLDSGPFLSILIDEINKVPFDFLFLDQN